MSAGIAAGIAAATAGRAANRSPARASRSRPHPVRSFIEWLADESYREPLQVMDARDWAAQYDARTGED